MRKKGKGKLNKSELDCYHILSKRLVLIAKTTVTIKETAEMLELER